jgi:CBS domain containing-hemolysin-like protein
LFAVFILVLANGFFVATEFSLVSVRRTRMQQLAAEGDRRAVSVLDRISHLDTYIAATQLGITISSIGLGWIGEPALAHLLEPLFNRMTFLPEGTRDAIRHPVSFAIAFSVITTLHIVFGELAPKSIALQRPDGTSLWTAGPIHAFYIVFRPAIALLNGIGNAVVRAIGIQPASGHELVQSADELRLAIAASREAGLVEVVAHDLVDRAFLFTDLDARQAMVPRTEMAAVPVTASLDDILNVAAESGYSRLPVYDQDLDHIVGVINVKRLLPFILAARDQPLLNGSAAPAFDVRDQMSEVLAVPETASASGLLTRLRDTHTPMAIVIDEFGGTAGLVTLEDLVESLVGEIDDDVNGTANEAIVLSDGSFVLDGLTTLVEAKEFYDLDLADEEIDVDTVGGYVFSRLGRPGVVGDEVALDDGRILRVEELDGLRIARIRVLAARPAMPEVQEPVRT